MAETNPRPEADDDVAEGTVAEDQQDARSEGGEGERNAATTPKLDEGGEAGQDQTPADPDDVGVPDDPGADKT